MLFKATGSKVPFPLTSKYPFNNPLADRFVVILSIYIRFILQLCKDKYEILDGNDVKTPDKLLLFKDMVTIVDGIGGTIVVILLLLAINVVNPFGRSEVDVKLLLEQWGLVPINNQ